MKLRVDMTSSPFCGAEGIRNLTDCRRTAEHLGMDFGVQLHNTVTESDLHALCRTGVRLSAHLPLLSKINFNLAAADVSKAERVLAENCAMMRDYGIKDAVFHAFHMTDREVAAFGFERSYDQCMREIFRPELSYDGQLRLNRDFTQLPEFLERRERLKMRLAELRRNCADLTVCVENDFPAYGSGNMLPHDLLYLEHPLCLDSSHLWATCHVLQRDFHAEAAKMLAGGRVAMVHFHASKYDATYPLAEWGDGHLPLRTPGKMDLPRLVRSIRAHGVNYFVLEIVRGTPDDLAALAEMWASGEK